MKQFAMSHKITLVSKVINVNVNVNEPLNINLSMNENQCNITLIYHSTSQVS